MVLKEILHSPNYVKDTCWKPVPKIAEQTIKPDITLTLEVKQSEKVKTNLVYFCFRKKNDRCIQIIDELYYWSFNASTNFIIKKYFFGAVRLTRNATDLFLMVIK